MKLRNANIPGSYRNSDGNRFQEHKFVLIHKFAQDQPCKELLVLFLSQHCASNTITSVPKRIPRDPPANCSAFLLYKWEAWPVNWLALLFPELSCVIYFQKPALQVHLCHHASCLQNRSHQQLQDLHFKESLFLRYVGF